MKELYTREEVIAIIEAVEAKILRDQKEYTDATGLPNIGGGLDPEFIEKLLS